MTSTRSGFPPRRSVPKRRSPRWVQGASALGLFVFGLPGASAGLEWARVESVPATDVYSLQVQGTAIHAGGRAVVHVGENLGASWSSSTAVHPEAAGIQTVLAAGGALWAGTFGHGVFRSPDGGTTWAAVNDGLLGLGSNQVTGMVERDGKIYAGTGGSGVFVLDLSGPLQWAAFNAGIPVSVSGSIGAIVLHGSTLLVSAGGNGFVYRHPNGAAAWQEVAVEPPIAPGLVGTDLLGSGGDLLLGTTSGVYHSTDDGETWRVAGTGMSNGSEIVLAVAGPVYFAGVDFLGDNHRMHRSADGLATWQLIDTVPGAFLYALQVVGDKLYAARTDGLWWTPLSTTPAENPTWGGLKQRFRE